MRKERLCNLTNCGAITGAHQHVLTSEKHLGSSEVCVLRFDPRKSNLKSSQCNSDPCNIQSRLSIRENVSLC